MDADYFWKHSKAVSDEFDRRTDEVESELGLNTPEGYKALWRAKECGDLPCITDASSMDDYIDKYRQQLTDWQHRRIVVENDDFTDRLTSKWHQRDRDVRPHEQAVLEFKKPEPEEPPKFVRAKFELLFE